jgi:hypothetical protein
MSAELERIMPISSLPANDLQEDASRFPHRSLSSNSQHERYCLSSFRSRLLDGWGWDIIGIYQLSPCSASPVPDVSLSHHVDIVDGVPDRLLGRGGGDVSITDWFFNMDFLSLQNNTSKYWALIQ